MRKGITNLLSRTKAKWTDAQIARRHAVLQQEAGRMTMKMNKYAKGSWIIAAGEDELYIIAPNMEALAHARGWIEGHYDFQTNFSGTTAEGNLMARILLPASWR